MKKVFLSCIFIILFSFNISPVFAEICDAEYMANLKEQVKNISVDYNYVGDIRGDGDYQLYEVSFTGMTKDVYIGPASLEEYVYQDGEKLYVDSGSRQFNIYSYYCADYKLKTLTVKLPKFNTYSMHDSCYGITNGELDVCDPWYQGTVSSNTFSSKVDSYFEKLYPEEESFIDLVFENIFVIVV